MKVAVVHSFHAADVPSGEDVVVRAQVEALTAAGHEVTLVSQSHDERRRRRSYRLEAAATIATGLGPDPTAQLRAAAPDVVHVHNLFPNFGTRWLDRWTGPVVATLHNFRPMCAAATLLRDGHRCTDCLTDRWAGLRHGCFRDSRIATLPLAVAGRHGAATGPVVRRADRLVAISQRAVDEFAVAGVDPARFTVVPNAVADVPGASPAPPGSARWLFLGRLSAEKGVRELLELWPQGVELDVVGDGELAGELRARPGVRLLGGRTNAAVRALLPGYTGLVVPSLWPEAGPPLTYVEALAAGVPTVAWAGNGAADDVTRHGTGAVVPREPARDELAAALAGVERDRAALSAACRSAYETYFSIPAWIDNLTAVYTAAQRTREMSHG
ncbi:glycosyltransferase family 4 protein [Blastococcus sp. URHD0036]|uniref:glycosyltransferase family 4 protein n=1 Tax=Blastococcus sp. URHD0036 TaxID=1380356 RepID=UPI00068E608C|nr:glycosyltransferase family 4 protein [Blastococcus sp. URHD0036]